MPAAPAILAAPIKTPAASGAGAGRAPPPPPRAAPPPAPAGPAKDMYKCLYNFAGQAGEMNLVKGELVELKEKDDNGWWKVAKNGQEGWAPSN
jgi:myosin-1